MTGIGRSGTRDEDCVRRDGPTRRAVLSGLAAGVAATMLPGGRARAAAGSHSVKLGEAVVTIVSDGHLEFPVDFQLARTPAAEVDRLFQSEGLEPPRLFQPPTNVTLVRNGTDTILIDAGSGSLFQDTAGKLPDNLEAAGVDRESVTKVVLTHAHPDHLWGVIDDFDDTERFPNATYVIAPEEWDFWTHPDTPSAIPEAFQGMARGTQRILKRIEEKIERRNAGETVAPGLTYVATAGHTPGHMAVMVESGGERLLVGGDALSHSLVSFARPDWSWGSDLDSDAAIRTRRRLLAELADERTPLIGFHLLPWPGLGRVERKDGTFRFVPA
jgi:glyoxylase-like metal-dependent hydrolase (beta-lactamase superfamily II)